jgi:phosphatidylglycerol:prolipoprotein diacylglycerol transferase
MHPLLFQIGSFKVASFGAVMVVAFFLAIFISRQRASRFGYTKDQVGDVAFVAILAGILGARLFFIVQELPYYLSHPKELFSPQFQGLTSFGGFLVGGFAAWRFCRIKKLNPVAFLDLATPGFILGHAVGRVGCLLNGCCHGRPAGHAFPFLAYSPENHMYNVPAQVYDSAMNVVAFALVLLIERKISRPGFTVGVGLVAHSITRFVYEFFRSGTSSSTVGGSPFTEAHILALVLALAGGVVIVRSLKRAGTYENEPELNPKQPQETESA